MKVLKRVESYKAIDIEPIELTLLSRGEYLANKSNIPTIVDCWWLRSPGVNPSYAADVYPDGSLSYYDVDYSLLAVRPALKYKPQNLRVADRFKFFGCLWTVIEDGIALCDTSFCRMAFRQDWKEPDANDYEKSDIKQYLDREFERMKNVVVEE